MFRLLGIYITLVHSWFLRGAGDMCKSSWINDILQMKVGQVSKMNSTTVQSHCKFLWILNMEFSLSNLLTFCQQLLVNINSMPYYFPFWVSRPVFRHFWSLLRVLSPKMKVFDTNYATKQILTQKLNLDLIFINNFW